MMTKHSHLVGAALLVVAACDSPGGGRNVLGADPFTGRLQIAAALQAPGTCVKPGPDTWTYSTRWVSGMQALVTKPAGSDDPVVVILDDHGNVQQGIVQFSKRAVAWYDSGEHPLSGQALSLVRQTFKEARAEWASPRGQDLIRLAQTAQAACAAIGDG